jgi:RTX calcium-binding nonapeptide repeat (4 copies)
MPPAAVFSDHQGDTPEVPPPMSPDRQLRVKTMAVLFAAVVSLLLVRGGHASPQSAAACTITGTNGPDILIGTPGRDVICGLGGNDVLDGNGGNDILRGGPGNDLLNGGNGNDVLAGGPGNDKLQGDRGSDRVYGGLGKDVIFAWDGFADKLDGGPGSDHAWKDMLDRATRIERYG